jgi:heme exporter protein CcmD
MTDPHTGFIVAAYGLAALVVLGSLVAIVIDYRAQRRTLADLEARASRAETGHE